LEEGCSSDEQLFVRHFEVEYVDVEDEAEEKEESGWAVHVACGIIKMKR
jgi:hypothetical protein